MSKISERWRSLLARVGFAEIARLLVPLVQFLWTVQLFDALESAEVSQFFAVASVAQLTLSIAGGQLYNVCLRAGAYAPGAADARWLQMHLIVASVFAAIAMCAAVVMDLLPSALAIVYCIGELAASEFIRVQFATASFKSASLLMLVKALVPVVGVWGLSEWQGGVALSDAFALQLLGSATALALSLRYVFSSITRLEAVPGPKWRAVVTSNFLLLGSSGTQSMVPHSIRAIVGSAAPGSPLVSALAVAMSAANVVQLVTASVTTNRLMVSAIHSARSSRAVALSPVEKAEVLMSLLLGVCGALVAGAVAVHLTGVSASAAWLLLCAMMFFYGLPLMRFTDQVRVLMAHRDREMAVVGFVVLFSAATTVLVASPSGPLPVAFALLISTLLHVVLRGTIARRPSNAGAVL